jgi:starch synthase
VRVAFVSSEVVPFCKTGGLADVSAALPRALARLAGGPEVHVLLPLYRETRRSLEEMSLHLADAGVAVEVGGPIPHPLGRFFTLEQPDAPKVHFLDCPVYFDRDGLYGPGGTADYLDNAKRFDFFCSAVVDAVPRLIGAPVDVFHSNDWQSALVAVLTRDRRGSDASATVLSIHNLAYQGNFSKETLREIGLEWSLFTPEAMEFYDRVSLLKGGIVFADAITTVSPTYAREIQTPEGGAGLDGVLRDHADRLTGILNGIDTNEWNPATDPNLPATYSPDDMSGKVQCKRALLEEMALPVDLSAPLVAVITRLAYQKGMDTLADIAAKLPGMGARFALLGSGDPALEGRFRALAARHPEHIAACFGYDEVLAHRIEAGADIFVMPSRYEPCGLNQMYSMAYGTVPVARAVGGLKDTIVDATEEAIADGTATGFLYQEISASQLLGALTRAVDLYRERPDAWRGLIRTGMSRDFSWARAARAYVDVYRAAIERRRGMDSGPELP